MPHARRYIRNICMHISCQMKAPWGAGGMVVQRMEGLFISETATVRFWTD